MFHVVAYLIVALSHLPHALGVHAPWAALAPWAAFTAYVALAWLAACKCRSVQAIFARTKRCFRRVRRG